MSDPFLAEIKLFALTFTVRGWAECNGQLLPISQNSALFSLVGTTYGGDGRTTFALPDLRGRVAMHFGNGPGLSPRALGSRSGQEEVTLTTAQIPQHNHAPRLNAENLNGNATDPAGNKLAKGTNIYRSDANRADQTLAASSITSNNVGGSQPHTNMQPYLVLNYQIALQGIFPSRN